MTNYEEFKAIADDIAEMYANGYAEYAEYFSETYSGIGELSAVTRISDKLYALRHTDVKDPRYTDNLKEIAIDAILAIGEINIIPVNDKTVTSNTRLLGFGERLYCCKAWNNHGLELVHREIYEVADRSSTHYYMDSLSFGDTIKVPIDFPIDEYFQKIIEKKS
jgi:hypothetical protein